MNQHDGPTTDHSVDPSYGGFTAAGWKLRVDNSGAINLLIAALVLAIVSLAIALFSFANFWSLVSLSAVSVIFQVGFVVLLAAHVSTLLDFTRLGKLPPAGCCTEVGAASCGAPHSVAVSAIGWTAFAISFVSVATTVSISATEGLVMYEYQYGNACGYYSYSCRSVPLTGYFWSPTTVFVFWACFPLLLIACILQQIAATRIAGLPGLGAQSCCCGAPPFPNAPASDSCTCCYGARRRVNPFVPVSQEANLARVTAELNRLQKQLYDMQVQQQPMMTSTHIPMKSGGEWEGDPSAPIRLLNPITFPPVGAPFGGEMGAGTGHAKSIV